MADLDHFPKLLHTLLSPDNTLRAQAEEVYSSIPCETKVMFLLTTICNASLEEEVRHLAGVLLWRLCAADFTKFYPKLAPDVQEQFKQQVLITVQEETNCTIRKKVGEIAAEIARNMIDEEGINHWPQFVEFLLQCSKSSSDTLKESALRMFTAIPGVFGSDESKHIDTIKEMMQNSLINVVGYQVRFQAVRALSAFIMIHNKDVPVINYFSELLPSFIQVTAESIDKQDDDTLMTNLIDLAECVPKFLRPGLDNVLQMCMKAFLNEEFSDSWRQLTLEAMITLAETAPGMLRKAGNNYIPVLIEQILKLMTDLEDDAEWSASDEPVDEDSDSNAIIGERALDRLACAMGGTTMMPQIEQNVCSMLANPDWRYRHAALVALSSIGEGCHKQMEAILPQILDSILKFLQDPHHRVRYAACNAIGQMTTDFTPVFQKKFHDKVVPALLTVMDDNENPRVQAHAGAALVNFSEGCPKNILLQYLDAIMTKLEFVLNAKLKELMEKGTKLVLEQVVTTIASIADASEEDFVGYYDHLMPCLKFILQNATSAETNILRGKTVECMSIIGLSVGAEKFMHDASEVVNMLLKTQSESGLEDNDPQMPYLIAAWARICKILGKQFGQYLPLVMGPVMKTASMMPEVSLLYTEEMEGFDGDEAQIVSLGENQNFGIKTSGMEDKALACKMLVCYARELKEGFAEYVEQVAKLMVPMLRFYFHDDVRSAAAEILPYLLESIKVKGPQYLQGLWSYICPELIQAVEHEPDNEVLVEQLDSLAKCIEFIGTGCLNEEAMGKLIRTLDKLMNDHFLKAALRQEKRIDEDYDEMVEEMLQEENIEDAYVLSRTTDVIHSLFVVYNINFYPYFGQIAHHFGKCLEPQMQWSERQWALCVFDDCIEFGGPACVELQEYFLLPMLNYITDKKPQVRQAAIYGWGVLGQCGGDTFAAAVAEAVPKLITVINDPESRALENINATENAISAVTKILKYNNSAINVNELLPQWLSWLPIWEDTDECPYVYGYLCDLMEGNHPLILGPNHENLPKLIAIISEAFSRDAIETDSEVGKRMVELVRQIQDNNEVFNECLRYLNAEQQEALHQALTEDSDP